jgi:hypothetical protein
LSRIQIYREAFDRDLWRSAIRAGAPGWPCPEDTEDAALREALREAWKSGDPHAILVIGRALEATGHMNLSEVSRVRLSLLRLGLFEEAARLTERFPGSPSDARAAYERAWALIGLDRPAAAQHALINARELQEYADPLARLIKAEIDASGAAVWESARQMVLDAIGLGLGGVAARQLAAALATGGLDPSLGLEEAELEDAIELTQAAMRVCGPAEAALLLDAVGPLYADGADRAAFFAVRDGLAGEGDNGADMRDCDGDARRASLRYLLGQAYSAARQRRSAIRRLGRLVESLPGAKDALCDLAREVAQDTLADLDLGFVSPPAKRKVFDVFPFNGEHAALEIKLNQMSAWVDRFVIVEAPITFDGRPKPLHFQERKARYAAFADRISHVVVDRFPEHLDTAPARACYQRDQAVRGLAGLCAPQDLVLLTDANVVLDGRTMKDFWGRFGLCRLQTYAYFLNLKQSREPDRSFPSVAIEARFLAGCGISYIRAGMAAYSKAWWEKAGWRFTRLASAPGAADAGDQERREIRAGRALQGLERAKLDEALPSYVRDRRRELADLIL